MRAETGLPGICPPVWVRRPAGVASAGAPRLGLGLCALAAAWSAAAQEAATSLQPVVIHAAAEGAASYWRVPASVDVVDGEDLRAGQLQVDLSEVLRRVPGLSVQSRQNQAQDLQVSIRGFGARASFGVRGVKLYVDGIPASAPDGQGQTASFPIGGADRVEVIRGPYSALYGSSAGGVIALYTGGDGPDQWRVGTAGGAQGLWRSSTQIEGGAGPYRVLVDASTFTTDGLRAQSAASRDTLHLKLSRPYENGRVVLIAQRQVGAAQDPLGLSRAEFDRDPDQVTPAALAFDTRKTARQSQVGLAWQHRLGAGQQLEMMGYGGQRAVVQYQSIPVSAQVAPGSPGGVIGLDRDYWGLNVRWRAAGDWQGGRWATAVGLATDRQSEWRRGFANYSGPASQPAALGVMGVLRRDEDNRADTLDPYAQLEWSSAALTWMAGVRRSRVRLSSVDHYVARGNPNDSGAVEYAGTQPVAGVRWRVSPEVQAWASAGRGLETPTLNEVAYRASGATGLNSSLAASPSRSAELGLRGRHGDAAWTLTAFQASTRSEIVVLSNTGGRSTYQNAGRTLRRGVELAGQARWGGLQWSGAFTLLDATYTDAFMTCTASPCTVPDVRVAAGNRIPGVARRQLWLGLEGAPSWAPASTWSLQWRQQGAVAVNDRNSDWVASWGVLGLAVRWQQDVGGWRWREFVRIDNLANRRYAGSVIVNEGNGRFFETAPGRSAYVGVELSQRR